VLLFLTLSDSNAYAASIDSEQINYGSACSGNIDDADWDTIAECSSSQWKRGPFFFGTSTDTCDSNHAGMVRFNSTSKVMEYCNSSAWTSLGATGAGSDYAATVNASTINVGYYTTCFTTTANAGYCIGDEVYGGIGNGTSASAYTTQPLPVSGSYTFSKISVDEEFACGLTTGGAIYCWGTNTTGNLGNGTSTTSTTPVLVSGGYTWTDVAVTGVDAGSSSGVYGAAAATFAACGITGGAAYCWGSNTIGELGTGNNTSSTTPVAVTGSLTFASLAISGGGYAGHMCGITTAGAAYCWGANNTGQLGNATTTTSNAPVAVAGSHVFSQLTIGEYGSCGVTTGNAGYCWGAGTSGVLGNGSTTQVTSPSLVNGSHSFTRIVMADTVAWGLTTTGTLYGWGSNTMGLLGTSGAYTSPVAFSPTSVTGTKWVDIGTSHFCQLIAVRDSGSLYAPIYCSAGMGGTPQTGSLILMQ